MADEHMAAACFSFDEVTPGTDEIIILFIALDKYGANRQILQVEQG